MIKQLCKTTLFLVQSPPKPQQDKTMLNGILYLIDGFRLIFQPGIKRFVMIPIAVNIAFLGLLFYFCQSVFSKFNHWLINFLPHWLHWFSTVLWVLFVLMFFLVTIYLFVTLANILAAPFNSLLSEKITTHLTGKKPETQNTLNTVKDIPRAIGRQLLILGYYIPRALGLFILFFIPIFQIIAAPLWFLFNAWFMALQYIDYPTDNQRIPFKTMRNTLSQKRAVCLSFGVGVVVFAMIPIINFFIIPAAVAGATKLWINEFT